MVFLDVGEWVTSNLLFGAVFVVAGAGVVGLFWYVLRGDRLNRRGLQSDRAEDFVETVTATREPQGREQG